jgi:hypothetical protein
MNVADLAQDMDAGLVNELVSALRDPVFGGVQVVQERARGPGRGEPGHDQGVSAPARAVS